METPQRQAAAQALVDFMRQGIPLAAAMDVQAGPFDGTRLTLIGPLPPNINDKDCAFAGSLVSLMTLACWGLVELALRERGDDCDVFVGSSNVRYLSPVWGDFAATAEAAPQASWSTFFSTLDSRQRARIEMICEIPGDAGKPAATLSAQFVAKRRPAAAE